MPGEQEVAEARHAFLAAREAADRGYARLLSGDITEADHKALEAAANAARKRWLALRG